MRVLVAGATGQTGIRLMTHLEERGHEGIALVRESSDTSPLPEGTKTRLGDLTDLPGDTMDGIEAVIFAAGSGGDTPKEMTDKVDRAGAKALIDLAAKAKITRFVMLSAVGADAPEKGPDEMQHYLEAKHDADEHLIASGLDYVIVRPVSLTKDDGDRDVILGNDVDPSAKAARGDLAALLALAVTEPGLSKKTFLMQSA